MPIRSRKAEAGTKTIAVEYEGESASVTFVPGRYDLGRTFELASAANDKDWATMGRHVVATLADMITAWDVTDADGAPEPITPENLATIDPQLLLVIWGAIRAEGNRPRTSAAISDATSSSAPASESAPGGIASSSPRATWGSPPGISMVEMVAPSGASGR